MRTFVSNPVLGQGAFAPFLDPSTVAWIGAVIKNGGGVSFRRQQTVDALITGLRSDGVWTKLDRLWLHAAENQASALTDLVADSLATAVNAPSFTIDRGFTGQDATSPTIYINSGYNATTNAVNFTTNACHISAWSVTNNASSAGGSMLGVAGFAAHETDIFNTFTDGNIYARINDQSASGSQGAPGTRIGHWIANRSGSNNTQLYQNGSSFSSPNAAAGSLQNANFYLLATNNLGTGGAASGTPQQIAMTSIGGNLSAADATNFYRRLRTYMSAAGVP